MSSHNTFNFNNYATIGQYIANVHHQVVHFDKDGNMQVLNLDENGDEVTPEEVAPEIENNKPLAATIDKQGLAKYFKASFKGIGGGTNFFDMLVPRLEDQYSNKDYCRIAVLIYQSKQLNSSKPATFRQWYKTFCDLAGRKCDEWRELGKHLPTQRLKDKFYFV